MWASFILHTQVVSSSCLVLLSLEAGKEICANLGTIFALKWPAVGLLNSVLLLLAVVLATGGCSGYGGEPAAPGVPTGPGTCIPRLFPPAALPGEFPVQCVCIEETKTVLKNVVVWMWRRVGLL
jgi:hypothetical protein